MSDECKKTKMAIMLPRIFLLITTIFFIQIKNSYSFSDYDEFKEISILSSPDVDKKIEFKSNSKIIDFTVLADNSNIIIISQNESNKTEFFSWEYMKDIKTIDIDFPDNFMPTELISHPQEHKLFILAKSINSKTENYKIFSYDIVQNKLTNIYSDDSLLKRLIVSSAKFNNNFRLYFARKNGSDTEIATITEDGQRWYPVVRKLANYAADWISAEKNVYGSPHITVSQFGLPLTFHPTGNALFWQRENSQVSVIPYSNDNWGDNYAPEFNKYMDKDKWNKIEFSPNGMYLLIWNNKNKDILILDLFLNKADKLLLNFVSDSKIKFTPDGKGIIYINRDNALVYKPLNLPLYDVENAWMFVGDNNDINLLKKNGGLFRKTEYKQMYMLYDSENYSCNNYSSSTPTRPYLVTTDPFHEILEAAYSGIFYVNERDVAIEYFNVFIEESKKIFDSTVFSDYVFWKKLFQNTSNILNGIYNNEELIMVKNNSGIADSIVLQKKDVNYAEFKARGYYEQNEKMTNYFKAVQYISMAKPNKSQWELFLNQKEPNELLEKWVNSYKPFIPPSKHSLPGKNEVIPFYIKHELKTDEERLTLFPKAWGIDNEILDSVVYHSKWPKEDQVLSVNGNWRLIPDLYELSYIFGSNLSKKILEEKSILKEYPMLNEIHKDLMQRWSEFQKQGISGIYNNWLYLISKQVSGKKPNWPWLTDELWETKQIQTGLASWTNLRHATVLVNMTGTAECGEGGFEYITRKPPRGAVEPHPEAFNALIIVFKEIRNTFLSIENQIKMETEESENNGFKKGIIERIDNVVNNLEKFKKIAEKEINNESLTNEEYDLILTCGRAVEHDFLVFKSIMTKDYGLAEPEPLSKVVDIYGDVNTGILHSAVGFPMEWDLIVPYYGRRQVVKGAIYSHYSIIKPNPISDKDWRLEINTHNLSEYINTYISKNRLICPAKTSFTSQ